MPIQQGSKIRFFGLNGLALDFIPSARPGHTLENCKSCQKVEKLVLQNSRFAGSCSVCRSLVRHCYFFVNIFLCCIIYGSFFWKEEFLAGLCVLRVPPIDPAL